MCAVVCRHYLRSGLAGLHTVVGFHVLVDWFGLGVGVHTQVYLVCLFSCHIPCPLLVPFPPTLVLGKVVEAALASVCGGGPAIIDVGGLLHGAVGGNGARGARGKDVRGAGGMKAGGTTAYSTCCGTGVWYG